VNLRKDPDKGSVNKSEECAESSNLKLKPWSAFEFSGFRMMWLSGVSSSVTMQMRNIGFGVWLYEETGSGVMLGLLGIVQLVAQMPATLFGGAFADSMDRRKLITFTQSFSFILIALATILLITDQLRPWHIYGIVLILGLTSTLGGPARSAITANIVPTSHLMHAVTSNTATYQISSILSPLMFTAAYEFIGISAVFILGVFTSVPATVMPLFVKLRYSLMEKDEKTNEAPMIQRLWEGFTFVRNHPILPGLYVMDIGVTVVSYYREIMPLIVDKLFRQGAWAIGPLTAANSLGGVAGSFLVLFMATFRAKGMLVLYATSTYAILLFAFGSLQFLPGNPIVLLVIGGAIISGLGMTDAIGMTTRQTTVQLTTPDNMRGRAVSFHSFCAMSANNIGTFEVGYMSSRIGAGNTMLLGGVVSVLVVIAVWRLISGLRNYRYP
jgi:MFS family permease|tara:strand:- start:626 stop:1945 length:1320 start_codon:yes stop_codon:yes gene_type:complete